MLGSTGTERGGGWCQRVQVGGKGAGGQMMGGQAKGHTATGGHRWQRAKCWWEGAGVRPLNSHTPTPVLPAPPAMVFLTAAVGGRNLR